MEQGMEMKQQTSGGRQLTIKECGSWICLFACVCVCVCVCVCQQWARRRRRDMHHPSCCEAASHLSLPWFNILMTPGQQHAKEIHLSRVCVCVFVCVLKSIRESEWKKRWGIEGLADAERVKKRLNAGKTIWLCRLMDASRALSLFFICFPLSLLISLPPEPSSLSPNLLTASIKEEVSERNVTCARRQASAHKDSAMSYPQKGFIRCNKKNNFF